MSYRAMFLRNGWTIEEDCKTFDGKTYVRYYRSDVGTVEYVRSPGGKGRYTTNGNYLNPKNLLKTIETPAIPMVTLSVKGGVLR